MKVACFELDAIDSNARSSGRLREKSAGVPAVSRAANPAKVQELDQAFIRKTSEQ